MSAIRSTALGLAHCPDPTAPEYHPNKEHITKRLLKTGMHDELGCFNAVGRLILWASRNN
ncbi:MAG: hypothetical protein JWO15_148 [Sphingomonadales bacterium]|nr:hypothetical protein [Sphingomonadales bacterium]